MFQWVTCNVGLWTGSQVSVWNEQSGSSWLSEAYNFVLILVVVSANMISCTHQCLSETLLLITAVSLERESVTCLDCCVATADKL